MGNLKVTDIKWDKNEHFYKLGSTGIVIFLISGEYYYLSKSSKTRFSLYEIRNEGSIKSKYKIDEFDKVETKTQLWKMIEEAFSKIKNNS